jgi:uncharacterized membrane protein YdjX (TVP38/TMEM64 family)
VSPQFHMSATQHGPHVEATGTCDRRPSAGRRFARALPLAALAAAAVLAFAFGLHRHLSLDAFVENRAAIAAAVDAHWWAALAGLALVYVVVVALSVPGGLVLTLVSGFLFGPLVGGVMVVAAATAGATLLFLAARSSLGDSLRRRAGPKLERLACGFCDDAFHWVLFLRLVPVCPFWLVNLAPALIGVRTRTYVIATAVGIAPATFAFATLGAGLDSAIAAQEQARVACLATGGDCPARFDPAALVTPELAAALVGLALLALVPVAVRRWRVRRGSCA